MSQLMLEEADSQLAHLVQQVRTGEEVVIVHNSVPIARLSALPEDTPEQKPASQFGNAKDVLIYMADDFDAPLEDFKEYM